MKPTGPLWVVYDDGDGVISSVFVLSGEEAARDFAAHVNDPANGYRYIGRAQVACFVPAPEQTSTTQEGQGQ